MNYFYTNKSGEKIYVDKNHLDTALKIKRELQMESPSHRVNWNKHKKMMEAEGYSNSESSENYRMLIRNYETRIVDDSYEELSNNSDLESLKEIVGDLYYSKREVQLETQKLGKIKRDISLYGILANEIVSALENINITTPKIDYFKMEGSSNEMLILPSDWHIGYLDNDFDFETAVQRVDKYLNKICKYAKLFSVNKFHIAHMGDIVENLYMHKNTQSFNAEFTFAEQIVKASELLFYLIEGLSRIGKVVYRGTIFGNHGRMSDKKETIYKDCAEYIVHEIVKKLIEKSKNNDIIIDETGYNVERCLFDIKGKIFKIIHGDKENQSDKSLIQKHISLENTLIDVLCMGHFHNYRVSTENFGRLIYQSGCLQGSTEYGRSLKFNNLSSQGLIVIGEDELIPININLQ